MRRFVRQKPDSYVLSAQVLHNQMWKEPAVRRSWVIITAIDEHLHHNDLEGYLAQQKRRHVTAIPALGYQMLAREFPNGAGLLAKSCTFGAACIFMNKLSLFDPNAIEETNFTGGRHTAAPTGRVRYPATDELLNLHFKYMGLAYVHARHQMLKTGLG